MILEVLTPERKIYSGEVYGVQLPGTEGLFEILENHAPMVAALGEGKMKIIIDKNGSKSETYQINGGFVETSNNKTSVVLESASQATE
jgi:F-type H+-transporting ATPase subunit epsilon